MIKFFGLIPRRPEMSEDEFHDHYRHPHGTLGNKIPLFRGYVQSHQLGHPAVVGVPSIYEAVAEVWFDTLADATGLSTDPHYVAYVQPDEPNFVDLPRLKWLFTHESVLLLEPTGAGIRPGDRAWRSTEAPNSVKLLQFLPGPDPLTADEVVSAAGGLGALRATRCTPVADVYRGEAPAFAAVRELWWPTATALSTAVAAAPLAWANLHELPSGSETIVARAERFR